MKDSGTHTIRIREKTGEFEGKSLEYHLKSQLNPNLPSEVRTVRVTALNSQHSSSNYALIALIELIDFPRQAWRQAY